MLATLTIISTLGATPLICTQAPPNFAILSSMQRTIIGATTNTQINKDRIYSVKSNSVVALDYRLSPAVLTTTTFSSDNANIPIDANGFAPFVVPGVANLFANTLSGTYVAYDVTYATNTQASSSNLTGFASGSLASNIQWSVQQQFAGKTGSQWPYAPNTPDLGTNQNVWTYPPLLSCVGISSAGFQTVLINSNTTLWNNHYFGSYVGAYATFIDTNGNKMLARYISAVQGPNDIAIATLESNMPSSIVRPFILPVYVTNNISSFLGLQGFWPHKNTAHVELSYVSAYPATIYGGGNGLFFANSRTNTFGNEQSATSGDSGSPAFFSLTNAPVILFAATSPGDVGGDPLFDPIYWTWLTNQVAIGSLNIVNLSGYPVYNVHGPLFAWWQQASSVTNNSNVIAANGDSVKTVADSANLTNVLFSSGTQETWVTGTNGAPGFISYGSSGSLCSSNTSLTQPFTWQYIVHFSASAQSGFQYLEDYGSGAAGRFRTYFDGSGTGKVACDSGGAPVLGPTTAIPDGWHMITVVGNGGSSAIYLDNNASPIAGAGNAGANGLNGFRVGNDIASTSFGLNDYWGEGLVYSFALAPVDIANNYAWEKANHWPFLP